MKKIIPLALSVLLLVGCSNSTFDKSVEEGKLALAGKEYEKAEGLFHLALDEKKDDKEVKALYDQTQKMVEAQKLKDEKKYDEAITLCDEIQNISSESDVAKEQAKKLKAEVLELKGKTSNKEKQDNTEEDTKKDKEDKKESVLIAKRGVYIQKLKDLEIQLENAYSQVYENGSNSEMIEAEHEKYTQWDYMLNEIYGELKKYLPKDEMNQLREKQRNWINERDKDAEAARKEFEGGTAAPLAYNSVLAEKTKDRCYQLVDAYMN